MTDPVAFISAPAKINLRLLVGPPRTDGYHPVDSLMVALDGLADTVMVAPADVRRVVCPGVEERANLAWYALDALEAAVGRQLPCEVTIDKRIPAQAGLGGGSSDAAATLHGANHLFGLGLSLQELELIAGRVGSDVPFFIRGGAQWARGRGEILSDATTPQFAALLVKPDVGLATADVYRAFDALPMPERSTDHHVPTDFAGLVEWMRNDLWQAALHCAPELAQVAARLIDEAGAHATLLCGSGSAVAGLFPTRADAAAAAARCPQAIAIVTPHTET